MEYSVKNELPYILLDDPPMFGPLDSLEKYLADVQAMPNFVLKASTIKQAKWYIAQLKRTPSEVQLSFEFLHDIVSNTRNQAEGLLTPKHSISSQPASGTVYRSAEGVQHPGEAGVIWGRTARDAWLKLQDR
jgi:hypothetical protein